MVACTSKSPSGTIDAMQKRVDAVERQVEKLYNQDFNYLIGEFQALDTTIARTKDISGEMELLQAYLQQFESQRIVIKDNARTSVKQLTNLKSDVKRYIYDNDTAARYIDDEENEIRVMEAQVKYFQEKLAAQKKVVKRLRKE